MRPPYPVFRIDRPITPMRGTCLSRARHANPLESLSASLLRNFIIGDLVERISRHRRHRRRHGRNGSAGMRRWWFMSCVMLAHAKGPNSEMQLSRITASSRASVPPRRAMQTFDLLAARPRGVRLYQDSHRESMVVNDISPVSRSKQRQCDE